MRPAGRGDGLEGRRVVVTGAASGIGAAVAGAMIASGARVVAMDLAGGAVARVAAELGADAGLPVDVADSGAVDAAFARAVDTLGGLDVLVNAAGVDDPVAKGWSQEQRSKGHAVDVLSRLTDAQWRRIHQVNLDGSFHVLRAALQAMTAGGTVVLIGSEAAVHGIAGLAHYAASKGGVHALVRAAAVECITRGVRINGIAPGSIDTPMTRRSQGVFDRPGVAPIGRMGTVDEIAEVALFLAGRRSSYVVGEVLNVDGGRTAS
jgi:3-oxoacyl-[acyl-carrier protein] reductase